MCYFTHRISQEFSSKPIAKIAKFSSNRKHDIVSHQSILCLLFNFGGTKNKAHLISDLLSTTNYDILIAIESWTDDTFPLLTFTAGTDFVPFCAHRNLNGGGIIIFVKKHLQPKLLLIKQYESLETITVAIRNDIVLSAVYWPPTIYRPNANALQQHSHYMSQFAGFKQVLCGDLNFAKIAWNFTEDQLYLHPDVTNARPFEREALLLLTEAGLSQINPNPNASGKYLDLVFIDQDSLTTVEQFDELHPAITPNNHHSPVAFAIPVSIMSSSSLPPQPVYKTISFTDQVLLAQKLSTIDTAMPISPAGIEMKYNQLLQAQIDSTFTKKKRIPSWVISHPWLKGNDAYISKRKQLNKLKKAGNHPELIKQVRKELSTIYHHAKLQYFDKIISQSDGNCLELFTLSKFKSSNKSALPTKMYNGQQQLTTEQTYEQLTTNFDEAFGYSEDPLYDGNMNANIINLWTENHVNDPIWTDMINVRPQEVVNHIKKLSIKKASGPSILSASFFISNCDIIAPVISQLFSACNLISYIPQAWKLSSIVPVPKKGDKSQVSNYRGIALQPIITKLFDSILTSKLADNVLHKITHHQHGFRPQKGTHTCIAELVLQLQLKMKSHQRVDALFVDFTKAFDRIPHTTIAKKLALIGTPLITTITIMRFITGRHYSLRETPNDIIKPTSSVPQGSNIGPLIFIIACNDLSNHLQDDTCLLQYADDVLIFRAIKDGADEDKFQVDIDLLSEWSNSNGFAINLSKTSIVKFSKAEPDLLTSYQIEGINIEELQLVRYLGILLDTRLTFTQHKHDVAQRATTAAHAAARLAKYIGHRKIILKLYVTYVEPILIYATSSWRKWTAVESNALSKPHHIVTRYALGSSFRPNQPNYIAYNDRCTLLNVATFQDRQLRLSAQFFYKIMNGIILTTIKEEVVRNQFVRTEFHRHQTPWLTYQAATTYKGTILHHLISNYTKLNLTQLDLELSLYAFKIKIANTFV